MGRPRKPWAYSAGRYGRTVRIFEPRVGAALRWDYRDETGRRHRPEVHPSIVVRPSPSDPVDAILAQRARDLCDRKLGELHLVPAREASQAETLTHAGAWALFYDPRRAALPKSRSARKHFDDTRKYMLAELGGDALWNAIAPADVWGALLRLKAKGQVQTAVKRLRNMRTLARWLREKMRIKGLEDPTLGLEVKKLFEGYTPVRPRLTPDQTRALAGVLPSLNWRMRLFLTSLMKSGTRGIQARTAMRSGLDRRLEPPPPPDVAPLGWFVYGDVKGQEPHLVFLTLAHRLEIARAIGRRWDGEKWEDGPLANWERLHQAGEIADYPLIPGGYLSRGIELRPVSDTGLRKQLRAALAAAGIPKLDRMGFHAIRRAWADYVRRRLGLDAATMGGGWSRRETVQESYTSKYDPEILDQVRRELEVDEG